MNVSSFDYDDKIQMFSVLYFSILALWFLFLFTGGRGTDGWGEGCDEAGLSSLYIHSH